MSEKLKSNKNYAKIISNLSAIAIGLTASATGTTERAINWLGFGSDNTPGRTAHNNQPLIVPFLDLGPATKDGTKGPGKNTPGIAGGYGAGGESAAIAMKDGTQGPGSSVPGQIGGEGAGGTPEPKVEAEPPAPFSNPGSETPKSTPLTQPDPFEVPSLNDLSPNSQNK